MLEGRIGNIIYYRDRHGNYLARQLTTIGKERFATDPAFARVKENAAEFGRASTLSRTMRLALPPHFPAHMPADGEMKSLHNRLLARLIPLLRMDTASARGARGLTAAAMPALAGFEWYTAIRSVDILVPVVYVDGTKVNVTVSTPRVHPGTVLKLMMVSMNGPNGTPAATDVQKGSFDYSGPVMLSCTVPTSGLWFACLGYLPAHGAPQGMSIIAAGGT